MEKLLEIIKYVFFGVITTAINIILFIVIEYIGVQYLIANGIGYFIAVGFNFYLNKKYVFKPSECITTRIQLIRFFVLRVGSLAIDTLLFYLIVDIIGLNMYLSRVFLSIFIILGTYLINKICIFK